MKLRDKIFVFLITSIMVLFAYQAYANAEESLYVNVEVGSYLNAREWPDANAKLVGRFNRGELITITEIDGELSRALFANGNSSGWVMTKYLSKTKPYEMEVGKYIIANTDGRVAVRKEANAKSKKVLWKYPDDEITVLSWTMQNDILWAKVKGGYIMGKYLELPIDSEKQE
jgi:hypothetical protein